MDNPNPNQNSQSGNFKTVIVALIAVIVILTLLLVWQVYAANRLQHEVAELQEERSESEEEVDEVGEEEELKVPEVSGTHDTYISFPEFNHRFSYPVETESREVFGRQPLLTESFTFYVYQDLIPEGPPNITLNPARITYHVLDNPDNLSPTEWLEDALDHPRGPEEDRDPDPGWMYMMTKEETTIDNRDVTVTHGIQGASKYWYLIDWDEYIISFSYTTGLGPNASDLAELSEGERAQFDRYSIGGKKYRELVEDMIKSLENVY